MGVYHRYTRQRYTAIKIKQNLSTAKMEKLFILFFAFVGAALASNHECFPRSYCREMSRLTMERFEYMMNETMVETINNRVLRNVYLNQRTASGNVPSNVEFHVSSNVKDQGYEFVQHRDFAMIPMIFLQEQDVPMLFGEKFSEEEKERYNMDGLSRKAYFRPANGERNMTAKFLCAGQPGFNLKCTVYETKMVFDVKYKAEMRNGYRNCFCYARGTLRRHDHHSRRFKVARY